MGNRSERVKTKSSFSVLFCSKCLVGIEEEMVNRQLSLELRGDFKARDNTIEMELRAMGLQVITKGESIHI